MYDPNSSTTSMLERQLAASLSNSLSSINRLNPEDFASGARGDGRMSLARRNFCIFVLFDLLLVSFVWFILEMVSYNGDINTLIQQEIVHYTVYNSMFDMVMTAGTRFTILLLFYGLLKLSTKWFEGITTAGTCAFLIFKGLYFDWKAANDKPIAVILLVASFILSWGEVWLFDWKVVPQEEIFDEYFISRAALIQRENERIEQEQSNNSRLRRTATDLLHGRPDVGSRFYTPQESHNVSDDEDDKGRSGKLKRGGRQSHVPLLESGDEEDIENDEEGWTDLAKVASEVVYDIFTKQQWSSVKKDKDATVYFADINQRRYFKVETVVHNDAPQLLRSFFENVDDMPTWNPAITESHRIASLRSNCDVIYQVTKKNFGVDQRDMVIVRRLEKKDDLHIVAFVSACHSSFPERNNIVRATMGPSCWAVRPHEDIPNACHIVGILNMDLKLKLPWVVLKDRTAKSLLSTAEGIRGLGNSS